MQVIDEPDQCVTLPGEVIGPQPVERRSRRRGLRSLDPPEEIVEAHGGGLVVTGQPYLLPERVPLEVAEDVARAG